MLGSAISCLAALAHLYTDYNVGTETKDLLSARKDVRKSIQNLLIDFPDVAKDVGKMTGDII